MKFSDILPFSVTIQHGAKHLMRGDGNGGEKDGKITPNEETNGFIESVTELSNGVEANLNDHSKGLRGYRAREVQQESCLSNAFYFDPANFDKISNLATKNDGTYDEKDLKALGALDGNPDDISLEDFRVLLDIKG